jgi:dipeptidyl aminopeptidase/acylaminoacyl peptidase
MRKRSGLLLLALTFFATSSSTIAQEPDSRLRSLRVDDQFARESVEQFELSPDGKSLAFMRFRPANSQITTTLILPVTRSDIWIQDGPGRAVRNLTNGASDSTGWWAPKFSADGDRLAFLSSRGGGVTLWVWDRPADRVRRVATPTGILLGDYRNDEAGGEAFEWIDDRRLLCMVAPQDGEPSNPTGAGGYFMGRAVERATAAWAKAARGDVTASVVDSRTFPLQQGRLFIVDVDKGTATPLGGISLEIQQPLWSRSPAGNALAFRSGGQLAGDALPIRGGLGYPSRLELRSLTDTPIRLRRPLPENILVPTLRWSPDGGQLAFFAYGETAIDRTRVYGEVAMRDVEQEPIPPGSATGPGLWHVDIASGRVQELRTGDLDLGDGPTPPSFTWTSHSELLFRASRVSAGSNTRVSPTSEWLLLDLKGGTRALATNDPLPASLEASGDASSFVGLLDGEVWSVDSAQGTKKNLTAAFDPKVTRTRRVSDASGRPWLMLTSEPETGQPKARPVVVLNLASGELRMFPAPAVDARSNLMAFDASASSTVFRTERHGATSVWRASSFGSAPEVLFEINGFMKQIKYSREQIVEYRGLNGEQLRAKLTLPIDYVDGRKYPVVVDSDTDYTPQTVSFRYELGEPDQVAALYASAGYAYLWTSMPTSGMDDAGRFNLLMFTSGVLPAIERVVAMGIADPDRVFLYGASSMGYGAYGLVTQTTRFKAAVIEAGYTDLLDRVLTIGNLDRYSDHPFDITRYQAIWWRTHKDAKIPFWRNGDHQRRNSPMSYVDRVETPVMIIHGDLDPINIEGAEKFFMALIAQRKVARFVRYFGEGHGPRNPANERDRWRRIFAWYDEYGDIQRDDAGRMTFDGDRVKSRNGSTPLTPEAFTRFGPAAELDHPRGQP